MAAAADIGQKTDFSGWGVLLFLMLFVSYGYFFQAGQDNGNARFAQVRSIIEEGKLNINKYAYTSADVVKHQDDIFPNKAPGTSLLAVPVWYGLDCILSWLINRVELKENLLCYLTTWILIGGITALTALLLYQICFRILAERSYLSAKACSATAFLLALGYGLGTIAFPFGTLFFSHQLAAGLCFLSYYLLFSQGQKVAAHQPVSVWKLLAAGVLLGLATATEYPAALAATALGIYSIFRLRRIEYVAAYVCGGLLGLLPLFIYQWLAFGSPWFIPYSAYASQTAEGFFPDHAKGFMGVSWPKWNVLYEITFGRLRGLFLFNPWLILTITALPFVFIFRKAFWLDLLLSFSVVILFFLFNAGYGESFVYWGGGASAGPRHLIPMLPFAVILIACAAHLKLVRIAAAIIIPLSALIMLVVTAVEPRAPYESANPLLSFYFDNFLRGIYGLDDSGTFSRYLLTSDSVSFNWGKLLDFPGWLQLAPLLLLWLVISLKVIARLKDSAAWRLPRLYEFYLGFLAVCFVGLPGALAAWDLLHFPGQRGLLAIHYRKIPWEGKPPRRFLPTRLRQEQADLVVIEKNIQISWENSPKPDERVFAVEWSGLIRIPHNGNFLFSTLSDDGSAVYLNGRLIVDNWGQHYQRMDSKWISLQKGYYPLVVRYFNNGFGKGFNFFWTWMDKPMQPVPWRYLYVDPRN